MNTQLLAVIITEGSKIISDVIRHRQAIFGSIRTEMEPPPSEPASLAPVLEEIPVKELGTPNKATAVETGCVPCSLGHLGTCTGLLNEATRFARKGGVSNNEVIDRVGRCLDELNAMEREDLRPELIVGLPEWEKAIAKAALNASRDIRHNLESITDADVLEGVAGATQKVRTQIGRSWFKERMARMKPEERQRVREEILSRIKDQQAGEEAAPSAEPR